MNAKWSVFVLLENVTQGHDDRPCPRKGEMMTVTISDYGAMGDGKKSSTPVQFRMQSTPAQLSAAGSLSTSQFQGKASAASQGT